MRRLGLAVVLLGCWALVGARPAPAAVPAPERPARAVIVFLPERGALAQLERRPALVALGLTSATLGRYSRAQALLDLSAGARVARAAYEPPDPPALSLGPGGRIEGWAAAVRRARSAPVNVRPGRLAAGAPGGAAYVGVRGEGDGAEAVVAAGRDGRPAKVSSGGAGTVAARARAALGSFRLVVVALPRGAAGGRALDSLLAARGRGDLVLALASPPRSEEAQVLPTGVAGLGRGTLSTATTRRPGLATMPDLTATVLARLGRPVPAQVRGRPLAASGPRDAEVLRAQTARYAAVAERRRPLLVVLGGLWALLLALGAWRAGARGARWAARTGALGGLWLPGVLLATAALDPSAPVEIALAGIAPFALGALTDRWRRWPRGPAVPAAAVLLLHALDLLGGSKLLTASLLGPKPRAGARFYGINNELEIVLTLLVLLGVGAGVRARRRSRRAAAAFAGAGALAAAVFALGRLGADVGAIFTLAAGAGVAALLARPRGVTARALLALVLVPLAALALLAAADLATGGDSHFTRTVLGGGLDGFAATLGARLELSGAALLRNYAPYTVTVAALLVVLALAFRRRLYGRLWKDPIWRATLAGGLAAALAGTVANDSSAFVWVIGVITLGVASAYLAAPPEDGLARAGGAAPPATAPGEREPARAPAPSS